MVDVSLASTVDKDARPLLRSLAGLSFGLLTFIVLAGTRPFQGSQAVQGGLASNSSSIEALAYLATTGACVAISLRLVGLRVLNFWMAALLVLFAYCALTLAWSEAVSAGLVRLGQLGLVTLAVGCIIRSLGMSQALLITYRVMLIILALNYMAVAFVPGSIHAIGEVGTYPSHITSWKGIHIHKNYAGPVAAMTVMMAMILALSGRWWHILVAVSAGLFLKETNSSASQLVLIFALAALIFGKLVAHAMGPSAARFALFSAMAAMLAILPFQSDRFSALMNDPYALTGRIEVWNALSRYIQAFPWTGSGFGSFWRLGDQSPILHLTDGWGMRTGQGHNGYLDIAATIGLPGLALSVAVLVLVPLLGLIRHYSGRSETYDVAFCFILFAWVHNTVETSLLSANHPVFFGLLIGIFGLGLRQRDRRVGESR